MVTFAHTITISNTKDNVGKIRRNVAALRRIFVLVTEKNSASILNLVPDGVPATFLDVIAKPAEIAQTARAIDCVVETHWMHNPRSNNKMVMCRRRLHCALTTITT